MKAIGAALAVAATLAVAGCGGVDGMELNGKMFDWLGISPAAQDARKTEPRLADRAPLVLPPDANRLPEPGSGQVAAPAEGWPLDPEMKKLAQAKERERLHMAYCRGEIQWKERALDPAKAGANKSPYGPCPGIGSITSSVNKN